MKGAIVPVPGGIGNHFPWFLPGLGTKFLNNYTVLPTLKEVEIPMNKTLLNYDPAKALDSPEAIAVFMADALETGDATYIAKAMVVVARAKGMAELGNITQA